MNRIRIVGIIVTSLAFGLAAHGQQHDVWTGDGDWVNTPANWTVGIPTSTSTVTVQSGTVNVSTTGTQAIAADTDNFGSVSIANEGVLATTSFENEAGATVNINAGGALNVSGTFTALGGATLILGNGIDFTPGALVLAGTATVTVNGSDSAEIGVVIDPPAGSALVKNGTGTLVLNQANLYTGGTLIAAGTLNAGNDTALGTGTVNIASGASLEISGASVLANNITISGTGAGGAGAIFTSDGLQNEATGTVTLAGDAYVNSSLNNLYLNGTVNLGAHELTLGGGASARIAIEGPITGTGGITVTANGKAVISSPTSDTYSGLTTVDDGAFLGLGDYNGAIAVPGNLASSGTVAIEGQGQQFAASTLVMLSGSGELLFEAGGASETIAGLDGSAATSVVLNTFAGGTTLTIGGTGTYDDAGSISDGRNSFTPLTVIKNGSGSQEFDGANSYVGGTTLNQGTLIAGSSTAFGGGLFQNFGGTLKLGNGNHLLSVGSYAQTNGTLLLTLAGSNGTATADQLQVTNGTAGDAALGGTLDVNFAHYTATAPTHGTTETFTYTLVNTNAGYTGTFTSFDALDLARGLSASLSYTGTLVDLDIVDSGGGNASFFSLTGLGSNAQAILAPINAGIAAGSPNPVVTKLVTALTPLSTNPAAFDQALNQLSALGFGEFSSVNAFNNASFETEAMDNYLAGQRGGPGGTLLGGNGNVDTSALTINDPNIDPGLQQVHSRMLAWSPAPVADGLISDSPDLLLSGVEMKDPKSIAALAAGDPWNFFARGNVILAQGFSNGDVSHFDDNTESVVVGADYRITPNFLIGLTAGYGHTDVTLDDNGSSATVDSYSPGVYASYADHGWYADLTGSYVHNAYTQNRVIGFLHDTATSAPEGDEGVANLDGGYDFHRGGLTFGPVAGLQYVHLTVDGYSESGSFADLSVNEQDADSLRSRFGGRVSYLLRSGGLTFTPHLDATWQHEFMGSARGITSRFDGAGLGSFSVRTDDPSRDSALFDLGLDAELNQTVTLFVDYTAQAGQENYFGQSLQAGVKIGF